MTTTTTVTWVRLTGDRLVRADHVVSVDLWGPPSGAKRTEPLRGRPARIMVRLEGEADDWQEAGTCSAERGGELVTYLVNLLSAPDEGQGGPRFVYGVYQDGELHRWMHGATIAADGKTVPPLHELSDSAPGSGISALART